MSGYPSPVTVHINVLMAEQTHERDGKLVFALENQEVYEWAADLHAEDPFVYERATVENEPWHLTGVRLSAFLVSVAVFEAILSAQYSYHVADVTDAELASLLTALRPLPMVGPTVGAQLYAGGDVLAIATPGDYGAEHRSPSTKWSVYFAARTADRLRDVGFSATSDPTGPV